MLKNTFFSFLFLVFSSAVNAQGNWLRYTGGPVSEETKDAVFDSNGNLVMTGF
ncbi:MAG: hypothetical protein IPM77_08865 [Crocinitomicaceae bacterium]|nr:hypothetical protein [Crocinitomicaceae bacterium]